MRRLAALGVALALFIGGPPFIGGPLFIGGMAQARALPTAEGSPTAQCLRAAAAAGLIEGVPDGLMARIAQVESARRQADGVWRPWPWTIDADGADFAFATKQNAVVWAARAPSRGVKLLDAGCLQVNLQAHSHAFASLGQAFDPWDNARYAARYLRQLHDSDAGGDWSVAVGMYHSHTPELAYEYRARVASLGAGIIAGLPPDAVALRLSALAPMRLSLANGHVLRIMLHRQPTAPGYRRPSACAVMGVLAPEFAVAARSRTCGSGYRTLVR